MTAYVYNVENNEIVAKVLSDDYDAIFNKLCELNYMGCDEYGVSFSCETLIDHVDADVYEV